MTEDALPKPVPLLVPTERQPNMQTTLFTWTGNQLELTEDWPLKGPSKVSMMSWNVKAQMAEPGMEFSGVVKTP